MASTLTADRQGKGSRSHPNPLSIHRRSPQRRTNRSARAGAWPPRTTKSEKGRIRHISREEWFEKSDSRGLNFIYQEQRSDGQQSNIFRLENPGREDA